MTQPEREERAERTAQALHAWTSIGPVFRLIVALAIIGVCSWGVMQIAELIIWISIILQP